MFPDPPEQVCTMPAVTTSGARSARPSRPRGPVLEPVLRPIGEDRDAPNDVPFEQAAAVVLGELQHALAELFTAPSVEIEKISDVEKAFGINHLLAWQLFRIVNAQNPLAAGMHVPARVSLKKLLTAATRRKVPGAMTDRVSDAFEAFERLVRSEAGDREEMDAMLSAFLPEERRKQDLASREAAFKGMSQIKGVASESLSTAFMLHPSAKAGALDRVIVNCEMGLRRLRPDSRIVIGTGDLSKPDTSLTTIYGDASTPPLGSLLAEFSTTPLPRLEVSEAGTMVSYRVAGDKVAMRSAIDLVTADRRPASLPAYLEEGGPRYRGYALFVGTPTKRLTIDVFAHRDAYPGVKPRLRVYDTAHMGLVARFDDPAREDHLLVSHEEVRALPSGLSGVRITHLPRYTEVLEHVFGRLGWYPTEFRGYRLDVPFPVYGAVYMLGFEVPTAPGR